MKAEPAVRAARGETGVTETPDYRGEMVLAAYTHIPHTAWGLVAKRDLAEVYAPIRGMLRDMALILSISVLIVIVVAFIFARLIARPMVAIAAAAGRIREGDLSARCVVEGRDEVARLAVAFNEMADTVASQLRVQRAGAEVATTAAAAATVIELAEALISRLMRLSGSNIGAFYLRSPGGDSFERISSVGLLADAPASFDAESREGEFGAALASRAVSYTSNISDETNFLAESAGGSRGSTRISRAAKSRSGAASATVASAGVPRLLEQPASRAPTSRS